MMSANARYWRRRKPPEAGNGSYWREEIVDPDGYVRHRFEEREQYLVDREDERQWIRSLEPGWVCDVGCGPGWWLADMPRGWRCVGVDPCQTAARLAKENGIIVYPTTLAEACLPKEAFDLVVHYHVIEHVDNPLQELLEVKRILKHQGWLLLGTPDFNSPCAKRFGDNYRMLHDPTHISLFTRESMHRMLRDNGFVVRDVSYPFPDRYATHETWDRWHETDRVSPPWPGNWMTFYAQSL